MQLLGVVAGPLAVADDRVLIDADEPSGLSYSAALGEVVQDGNDLVLGQAGVEKRCALAFGEADLTGAAGEHAALLGRAVAEANAEVGPAALSEVGASRVLTTEAAEVIHEAPVEERRWFREAPLTGPTSGEAEGNRTATVRRHHRIFSPARNSCSAGRPCRT